jgi:arylsulfatase A-like enzyme
MPFKAELPSLLFITIDCLRADHVGFLGYRQAITPTMDCLAAESIVFANAVVAGSPTYYAFPALLAGRFPLAMGRDVLGLCPDETTLASHLREQGYRTGAIVAGNPYLSRWMGYDQGFDYFEDFLQGQPAARKESSCSRPGPELPLRRRLNWLLQRLTRVSPVLAAIYQELYFSYSLWITGRRAGQDFFRLLRVYPPAEVVSDRAIAWLKSLPKPFCLWLHYMDAHRPYCPPMKVLKALGREDLSPQKQFRLRHLWLRQDLPVKRLRKSRQDFLDLYDACISSLDSQVGRLLEALDTMGLLENTMIVLTSDHGEAFLERGERDHLPVLATQEILRVPLLIRLPKLRPTLSQVDRPFSLMDLLPTVLDMAGFKCPPSFTGRSRWPALQNGEAWKDPAITEMIYSQKLNPLDRINSPGPRLLTATTDRYKLTINFAKGSEELVNLAQDPQELRSHPLSQNPRVSIKLLRALHQHLEQSLHNRYSRPELTLRLECLREITSKLSPHKNQRNTERNS